MEKDNDRLFHLQAFISSLSVEERAKTLFSYDDPERLTWARSPQARKGFALKDMSASQRQIVDAMLKSVLSEKGFASAKAIMSDQDVLAKHEEGLGAGYFWMAIYGEPGISNQWAWRLGGHHLSLHFTYVDNKLISCMPAFFGAEQTLPAGDPQEAGYKLLVARRDLARELVNSLNQEQVTRTVIAARVSPSLVISEGKNLILDKPMGLPISGLAENQRALFFKLIEEYAGVFEAAIARVQFDKAKIAGLKKIYFAWAGNRNERNAENYYRIQGPNFEARKSSGLSSNAVK
ncbi:DUF3500 domain-containing protein [candidate division KSB1 bacterium]|nr:DUF3500 domain-containing protein [candidate division KSB1 bacterium]